MKDADTIMQELAESLSAEERGQLHDMLASPGAQDGAAADPWEQFSGRFGWLRWANAHTDTYDRLQRTFAAWLEEHHDPRGEFLRLHYDLAALGKYPVPDGQA